MTENCPKCMEYACAEPLLFGDYRNAMDDGEMRIYEDLLDYENCRSICQEVSNWSNAEVSRNDEPILLLESVVLCCLWKVAPLMD